MNTPVTFPEGRRPVSGGWLSAGAVFLCLVLPTAALGVVASAPEGAPNEESVTALLDDGDYAAAVHAARRLLAGAESLHGQDSLAAARALDLLVKALRGAGTVDDETVRLAKRSVSIRKARLGPDDPDVAAGLGTLGLILQGRGSYAAARPALQEALAILQDHFGPDHPQVATALNNLGSLLNTMGSYTEAREMFERALAIRERHLGPEDFYVATTLNNLAMVIQASGDHAEARPLFERSLAIREKQLGPDHPSVAIGLNNLGRLLHQTGDYADARRLFERALSIRERRLGHDHPSVSTVSNNLASLLQDTGDYIEARTLYERSLAIRETQLGPDHPAVATALTNLATLLKALGDHTEAHRHFERALAIHEKRLAPGHPLLATSLNNLGSALKALGRDAEARPLLERSLAIREQRFGPDHLLVAASLNNLAGLLMRQGEQAEAKDMFERALRINEDQLGPEHPTVATALNNLAQALGNAGDDAGARPLYERALSIRTRQLGDDHPLVAATRFNLADLLARLGDAPAAFDHALRAETIARTHVQWTMRTLHESQALRYAAVSPDGASIALSLVAAGSDGIAGSERRVWDELVRSRAVVLDELAARRRELGSVDDPESVALFDELAAASRELAGLMVRGPKSGPPERHRKRLEGARRRREIAERRLAQRSLSFRSDLERRRVGLEDVVRHLPADSALVAYVLYPRREYPSRSPESGGGVRDGKPRRASMSYAAFVLGGPGAPVRVVHLGPADGIDVLIRRWLDEASRGSIRSYASEREAERAYRIAGEALRREIWDPIVPHIEPADRVFIVADGELSLVSYASLPVGDSGFLLERGPLVHYLSAERDLVRPEAAASSGEGLLAVGGVAYDEAAPEVASPVALRGKTASCADFRSIRFTPLPGTAQEAERVVALWTATRSSGGKADPAVVHLTGAEASEAAFKIRAPGRRVLHLATHGFFLGGRCVSALTTPRGVGGLVEAEPPPGPSEPENPLRLSGLVFAGANRRDRESDGGEDGILTAEEIAAMDLSGVRWAVLSACDTGVGEIRAGEGVFGLRRAFRIAGAETLILSLWPVEDESAREWMEALYGARLVRASETAEAVREAGLAVLRRRRAEGATEHPFYWAGFVAAGDWR